MLVAVPRERGLIPVKTLAFATALVALSSTSAQASSVGSMRLDMGSTGLTVVAREQDVSPSLVDTLDEIKRRSGLTWGQLATIFQVSRRTVHSWANGAAVRIAHAGRVSDILERIRSFDGLPAFKVRELLLGQTSSGIEGRSYPIDEPPVLASDNTPFVHQLELRPARTKVKRG